MEIHNSLSVMINILWEKMWQIKYFLKDVITFVQQRHIKHLKTDSKAIYNTTKEFYF